MASFTATVVYFSDTRKFWAGEETKIWVLNDTLILKTTDPTNPKRTEIPCHKLSLYPIVQSVGFCLDVEDTPSISRLLVASPNTNNLAQIHRYLSQYIVLEFLADASSTEVPVTQNGSTPPAQFTSIPACPICLEDFDDGDQKPAVGKCGHSLCLGCCRNLQNAEFHSCPICRLFNAFFFTTINYSLIEQVGFSKGLQAALQSTKFENKGLKKKCLSQGEELVKQADEIRWKTSANNSLQREVQKKREELKMVLKEKERLREKCLNQEKEMAKHSEEIRRITRQLKAAQQLQMTAEKNEARVRKPEMQIWGVMRPTELAVQKVDARKTASKAKNVLKELDVNQLKRSREGKADEKKKEAMEEGDPVAKQAVFKWRPAMKRRLEECGGRMKMKKLRSTVISDFKLAGGDPDRATELFNSKLVKASKIRLDGELAILEEI